ncbi:unnamed protein product [Cladocopium goreaui]|uniref:Uncharacterized protein n=1 Tax=Cladocopium goreaui TaxID=2562237 RepID=A0A9P1CFW8_9DINO|nr:unnamed protein product [Cladocopium goreaui]
MFSIKVDGQKLSFQTTCKAAGMQKDAAEQICQLCYEKTQKHIAGFKAVKQLESPNM